MKKISSEKLQNLRGGLLAPGCEWVVEWAKGQSFDVQIWVEDLKDHSIVYYCD
jgi:hypothetical protein